MLLEQLAESVTHWSFVDQNDMPFVPLGARLRVSQKCNARCRMCNVWRLMPQPSLNLEIGVNNLYSIVEQMASAGCRFLSLSGGEPTLFDDLSNLITYASSRGLQVMLTTNGLRVDEMMAQTLVLAGLKQITFSIHGAGSEVHDQLVGKAGAFVQAVAALKRVSYLAIQHLRLPYRMVAMVITRHNIQDLLSMPRRVHAWGANGFEILQLQELGPHMRSLSLDRSEAEFVCQQIIPALREQTDNLGLVFEDNFSPAYSSIANAGEVNPLGVFSPSIPCFFGRAMIGIDVEGRVYPCCFLMKPPYCMGELRSESLIDILQGPRFTAFLQGSRLPYGHTECRQCYLSRPFNQRIYNMQFQD